MKKIYYAIFLLIFSSSAPGQITKDMFPYNYNKRRATKSSFIKIDKTRIKNIRTFESVTSDNSPYRYKKGKFGEAISITINSNTHGKWYTADNNYKIWETGIYAKDAKSIQVIFSNFELPDGGMLFVYNRDKTYYRGAFTSSNNKPSKRLAIAPVKSDKIVVQYIHTNPAEDIPTLIIDKIVYDFLGVFDKKDKGIFASGSCNVNINCDEGSAYQDTKRSIARIFFDGYYCTGALVNNTNSDETPYFLTANHCINSEEVAKDAVFLFNYESSYCGSNNASSKQSISGSKLIATGANNRLDFTLLQLSTTPPEQFQPYYLGWSASENGNKYSSCIHHPSADIKKISIDYDSTTTSNYGSHFLTNSHWLIRKWDIGTTEGGSSGSPLLNKDGQVIGTLTGGEASCSYNFNDLYQKMSYSWNYYEAPENQLKFWLDPGNSGTESLEGYDPYNTASSTRINIIPRIACPLDTIVYRVKLAEHEKKNTTQIRWVTDKDAKVFETETNSIIKVVYNRPGRYSISATIGNTESVTLENSVLINPCASIKMTGTSYCPTDTITLQAEVGDLKEEVQYSWIFDDEVEILEGNEKSKKISFRYINSGEKRPSLNINDSYAISTEYSINVLKSPLDPVIRIDYHKLIVDDDDDTNHQWYRNNIPIVDAREPMYNVSQSGSYHVKAQNIYGCILSSDTINVPYQRDKAINIVKEANTFPNVITEGKADLQLDLLSKVENIIIQIVSSSGQVLVTQEVDMTSKKEVIPLDLSKLDTGIYVVYVYSDLFTEQFKIIVR